MPKDNSVYIEHIIARAEKILQFVAGMNEDDFLKDEKTQSAVIREFEVIGEASKRISVEFKNIHSHIPWKLMSGMRDLLIHDYEGVNPIRVWDTIKTDIPTLIKSIKEL
jgi:uncharacterized protein with HEPN domain